MPSKSFAKVEADFCGCMGVKSDKCRQMPTDAVRVIEVGK
jgi:hypothetical protein